MMKKEKKAIVSQHQSMYQRHAKVAQCAEEKEQSVEEQAECHQSA